MIIYILLHISLRCVSNYMHIYICVYMYMCVDLLAKDVCDVSVYICTYIYAYIYIYMCRLACKRCTQTFMYL